MLRRNIREDAPEIEKEKSVYISVYIRSTSRSTEACFLRKVGLHPRSRMTTLELGLHRRSLFGNIANLADALNDFH